MSRKFTFHIGSVSPKDDRRLLRDLMRAAQHGDSVEACIFSQEPGTARTPNEPKEQEFAEALNASLEAQNAHPPAVEHTTPVALHTALDRLRNTRKVLNDAGVKLIVEAILKEAWDQRMQLWESVKASLRDAIP